MNEIELQLIETSESLERAKFISKLLKAGLATNNTDVMKFINNFVKENE